jgi:hypothetical protein
MLRSANEFIGYILAAKDGEIGRCKDLLFDDVRWTIRYMVADTRKWLPGRRVLISPISLDSPDWASGSFPVRLTKDQIKGAPDLDEDAPVSRQYESYYMRHYNWPPYWGGPNTWAASEHAASLFAQPLPQDPSAIPDTELGDPCLRSMGEVLTYSLKNESDPLGSIHDFIVEDETWIVRHLVVDTGKWLPGRKVLIPTSRIHTISWKEHTITVPFSKEMVISSPPFDPSAPVNEEYVQRLVDYYGRPTETGTPERVSGVAR